jgi:hypothetical protein
MYAIVDLAIRKEISWQEARARLNKLILENPSLFEVVDASALAKLAGDESEHQADSDAELPSTQNAPS